MKLCNFAIIGAITFVILCIPNFIHGSEVTTIIDVKQQYKQAMEQAVDDAMNNAVESDNGSDVSLNKDYLIEQFYHTLYINLNCTTDTVKQDAIKSYIPIVVLVDKDGFYVNYTSSIQTDSGERRIAKNWSEKIPFTYIEEHGERIFHFTLDDKVEVYDSNSNEVFQGDYRDLANMATFHTDDAGNGCYRSSLLCDGDFDTIRRLSIINTLTETMEYYINQHNQIAKQFGITYQFSLPYISEDDWARTIDDISLFSLFQGYPYISSNPKLGYLNIYAIGGARIVKSDAYYIAEEDGKMVYHKASCPKIKNADDSIIQTVYDSPKECSLEGAFPCHKCKP